MASHPPWYVLLVAGFFFVFWAGYWVVHVLALAYARWRLYARVSGAHARAASVGSPRGPDDPAWPGVSILKPLVGVDRNLPSNLETFFTMSYPGPYELLFCVSEQDDPALGLCRALTERYPGVDARIFIGGEKVGENPKINNMEPGYKNAKYELVMISDSGLRMREDTLTDMVSYMTDRVGLVHQMPFVCDREGFASVVEKVYFGTCLARIYLAADLFGINSVTGMSCLFRKAIVDDLGGLKAFGCYLAEDYFLGKNIQKKGFKLRVTSQPAWQNPGPSDIPSFQARIRRWTQLRIAMVPTTIILEPLQECVLLGFCTAWATWALFRWDPLVFFLVHCLSWFLMDYCLLTVVNGDWLNFSKFEFLLAWLFREFNATRQFALAFVDPVIRWRTGSYRLKWGGMIHDVKPLVPTPAAGVDVPEKVLVMSDPRNSPSSASSSPLPSSGVSSPNGGGGKMFKVPFPSGSVLPPATKKKRPPSSACSSYPTHFPTSSSTKGGLGKHVSFSSQPSSSAGSFERDAPW